MNWKDACHWHTVLTSTKVTLEARIQKAWRFSGGSGSLTLVLDLQAWELGVKTPLE
jgi:hypothetical protein